MIAKYCDLSMSRRSIICLSLRLRQIIDLLATDKSQYFAQPRPIIVNYFSMRRVISHRVQLSLIVYSVPEKMASNTLAVLLINIFILYNIIVSVAFISFAKKVATDFCQLFSQFLRILNF